MCASYRPLSAERSAQACARNMRRGWLCVRRWGARGGGGSRGRSVRVVLTRQQMYGLSYRPATIERLALGAKADGTLDAVTHEAVAVTSEFEDFSRSDTGWAAQLYKSANAKYVHRLARAPVATPPTKVRRRGATARWTARSD